MLYDSPRKRIGVAALSLVIKSTGEQENKGKNNNKKRGLPYPTLHYLTLPCHTQYSTLSTQYPDFSTIAIVPYSVLSTQYSVSVFIVQ